MLKSKEKRDTVLLVFMMLIIIVFLVYVFIPGGNGPAKGDGGGAKAPGSLAKGQQGGASKTPSDNPPEKDPEKTSEESEREALEALNRELQLRLKEISADIMASARPFEGYPVEPLKTLLESSDREMVDRLCKFSFFDLSDIVDLSFPASYSDSLKFNLYLSLFLVKLREDNINSRLSVLPPGQLGDKMDLRPYNLLNRELQEDYQLLPVLYYFDRLLRVVNAYGLTDELFLFRDKIKDLRDLTSAKRLDRIVEVSTFFRSREIFRVEWLEDDLSGDDRGIYRDLDIPVYRFLGQSYIVFPDPDPARVKNNRWLKDLCAADSGAIELVDLKINHETSVGFQAQKVIYRSRVSRFIVLFSAYEVGGDDFFDRLLVEFFGGYHRDFEVLEFSWRATAPERFKGGLQKFGHYLKRVH